MKYTKEKPQQVKLSDTKNMLHKIAEMNLRYMDKYFCMLDGIPSCVTK